MKIVDILSLAVAVRNPTTKSYCTILYSVSALPCTDTKRSTVRYSKYSTVVLLTYSNNITVQYVKFMSHNLCHIIYVT